MPDNLTPITGDDIEQLLAENGGVGAFEDSAYIPTERWHFPRFTPKCKKCSAPMTRNEDGSWSCPSKGKHTVNYEMDDADFYLSRAGIGEHDTDVETIVAWLEEPRNIVGAINLLGDPGTGKTALIEAACTHSGRRLLTWLCTPDDTADSLFLRFVGEGNGDCMTQGHNHPEFPPVEGEGAYTPECHRSAFTLGPIPYACKWGYTLYKDEWMMLVDGVKPRLYPLADGRRYLPAGNVDGTPLEIHDDFRLVLSSNPMVRGASMPEPMASRTASTTLTIETHADLLRDLGLSEDVILAWEGLGDANLWRPQIREVRLADYWLNKGIPEQAVSAFLPEHCPESDRDAVRSMVQGFLGGDIRSDGRLVVA